MAATKRIVNYSNAGIYQVLSADVGNKHGFSVSGLVSLEDDADWTDEANWYKINPSLGYTVDIERLRDAPWSAGILRRWWEICVCLHLRNDKKGREE